MIIIDGRIFVDILIDGNPLPTSANLVERLTMTEGNGALSPAVELILNDHSGHLGRDLALTDGNEILITIGKSASSINTVPRQYRLFGYKQLITAYGPQIQAIGTLDAPGYLTSSTIEAYKGTTSQALLEIAVRSKMCYSGPEDYNGRNMSDSQKWRAVCQSRASHAQDISRHGYLDEHSGMMLVATSLGCLKYRNLSDVIDTPIEKIKRIFIHSVPTASKDSDKIVYEVRAARDRSVSGLMNNWQNYGSTRFEHTLDGVQEAHKSVDVKTQGSFLAINAQVSDTVVKARREYGPLDCGNTHKNYERALYQNIRQLSLFSEKLSILVTAVTDVQLLDAVIYRQANADITEPVKNSDVYIVIGKSILLKGGMSYAERIELARMSITTKGKSILKCADPASDANSVIPSVSINPTINAAKSIIPTVKTISGLAVSASTTMGNVKSIVSNVSNAVASSTYALSNVLSAVKTLSNPAALLSNLKSAIPALRTVSQVIGTMNSLSSIARSGLNTFNYSVQAIGNVKNDLRGAIMGIPNGIMDSYSSVLGATKQVTDHLEVLRTVSTRLVPEISGLQALPGGAQVVQDFKNAYALVDQTTKTAGLAAASMWNTSVSLLSSKPVPATSALQAHPGGSFDKTMGTSFTTPNYSLSSTLSSSAQSANTQMAMAKKIAGELPWQPVVDYGLLPKQPLTVAEAETKILEMQADASVAIKRTQEQGPTWT